MYAFCLNLEPSNCYIKYLKFVTYYKYTGRDEFHVVLE